MSPEEAILRPRAQTRIPATSSERQLPGGSETRPARVILCFIYLPPAQSMSHLLTLFFF